jgi:pyrroloquinoline quinone biosynthesis protein B
VAISADGERWFLVNASPDLREQIESFPPLQPRAFRGSPIEGVLVTNADLDHTLGLFLLRGGEGVRVFAPKEIWKTLEEGLNLGHVLRQYGGVTFSPAPDGFAPLTLRDGTASGLRYRAIPLPGNAPRYARSARDEGQSFAFLIEDEKNRGAGIVVAPDVAQITPALREALGDAALILFDGTFWTEDELQRIDPTARTASAMGHLPIRNGSLPVLRELGGRRVYLHINNTNPMLASPSPERSEVERAGIEIGADGAEFEVR